MSQECPLPNNPDEEPSAAQQAPRAKGLPSFLTFGKGNLPTYISNRYWWLFNDLRLSPSTLNPGLPIISTEAFLELTH
ncbi:hypothetical protein BHE74_00026197 [Ensete ventricosum]|nr:hypothetical protein BHE74_00026197 [Ensete ventricosum]